MARQIQQYNTSVKFKISSREKQRLINEATKRGLTVAELLRSWVHRLPALEDEVDPI